MFSLRAPLGAIVLAILVGLGTVAGTGVAQATDELNIKDGYMAHGYDVVAYFTDGNAVVGNDQYTAEYDGAKYRFASADNRDKFQANPDKYAPQLGGYCAFGTAMGRKFDGDPTAWKIVDGKLYLNLNKDIQKKWLENPAGFIRGANHNWPVIASVPDATLEKNPPAGLTQGPQ
jgi:YHS domain-containing protein